MLTVKLCDFMNTIRLRSRRILTTVTMMPTLNMIMIWTFFRVE